ncbi:TlpA family protein disulfide reductase [Mucilaginibacter myungsuensis]|uniref:AhpC/TSA family protein n=1 Tax=Mucilaginibacter myungsuensis TaxID=649104 RepID=A0A929L013_9SPHI|nr:thioredoxin fold domain-containing protein [Mucilaginibacter myungsuensis]MBE9661994.1 AhpC/TSA family protein [Mucilaginibacter myungsuensis]MDN3599573.1 AhpC/TSA family protein [Mucilaginibacter myungsuensis]
MKKTLVSVWLLLLIGVVGGIFWYAEFRYQLPTPVPEGYVAVKPGTMVQLPQSVAHTAGKPLFLHFFNPDCPCSRFNIKQFKELVQGYGDKVDFRIVVLTTKKYSADDIRDKFDLDLPISFDQKLADLCGVYSTPQVALLDAGEQLYYRGNYNRSRYCTDKETGYARIALEGLMAKKQDIKFNKYALTAYGCSLPGCEK